jgi:hypothetical protein
MMADEPRESFSSDQEGVEIKLKPPDSASCGSSSCKNWIEEINTYHPSYQSGGGATIIFKVKNALFLIAENFTKVHNISKEKGHQGMYYDTQRTY